LSPESENMYSSKDVSTFVCMYSLTCQGGGGSDKRV